MINSISSSVYQPIIQRNSEMRHGPTAQPATQTTANPQQLSPEAQQQVAKLRAIDQKIRLHEQAHISAASGLGVSGANFQTQRGPDGKNYAVAGEVRIDVSPAKTPQETMEKARRIQAAALAPSDPSSADRAVAAAAAQMEARASAELSQQNNQENSNRKESAAAENQYSSNNVIAQNKKAIATYQQIASAPPATQLLAIA